MNTKPVIKLKDGAVTTPLKRLSSENRIRKRQKLTNFLVTNFGLTKIERIQSFDTLAKYHTISNVTKCLDWILSHQRNFMDRVIVLDTSVLKNVYRFILFGKYLKSICEMVML